MRLSAEVVDLIGLDLLDDVDERGAVRQVSIVEDQAGRGIVWVLVEMVDARGVEEGRATLDTVDFVPLGEKKFGEIRPVLTGDSGDKRFFQLPWSPSVAWVGWLKC